MNRRQREALNRAKRLALTVDDVQGVDFGVLYHKGRPRGRSQGIRFHVARKRAASELRANDLLPGEIDGVPCDVVQASYQPHAVNPTGAVDPLQPGISIGNLVRQSTGSLGAFVRDRDSGALCILSNWHVLCGSTSAMAGETISQPGPRHLGVISPRPVAQLLRWSELSHGIDAAIAQLAAGIAHSDIPLGLTTTAVGVAEPKVGLRVVKSGTVTEVTFAIVDGIDGSYPMDYGPFGDTKRWMDGIRLVVDPDSPGSEISLQGDSGAIWIDRDTNRAIGLHFAGEDGLGPLAEYALAHPLSKVLKSLRVE